MFVDKAKIYVKAGNGGNGAVAFRREIYVPAGGPNGGDGGKGGNIVILGDNNMRTLMDFKYKKKYVAESGEDGKGSNMFGKYGEDLVLKVPVGTVVRDEETNLVIADIKSMNQKVVIARGGYGGKGNTHFKNSIRQAPAFAKAGKEGEEKNIILELKLLADVGLIGFPNVGKSTFLSIVTKANPKIANYHFTTLTPNLGVAVTKSGDSFVIADIPGVIEGAHQGVGLGHDFLRHIERTKLLAHVLDASGIEGRDPYEDFIAINEELNLFNPKLMEREQFVIANKIDLIYDEEPLNKLIKKLEADGYKVFKMSGATKDGFDDIIEYINVKLKEIEDVEIIDEDEIYSEEKVAIKNKDEIKITVEEGVYVVEGKSLEKLLYSVNFEDMESIRFFQKVLESCGVFERLRSMGINDGEAVRIQDLEFEFFD
ncbi:MAG: GTPase ObgE [Filifactoraceae bacterium]